MPDAPPATVEDMFVQTASGIRTDDGATCTTGKTPVRARACAANPSKNKAGSPGIRS
jgi:hypothetical protein